VNLDGSCRVTKAYSYLGRVYPLAGAVAGFKR
jgi:hypothetical protein